MRPPVAQGWFVLAGMDSDSQAMGLPLPEGGVRFAIHPVSGLLTTSQTHVSARDTSAASLASHRPQRVDKFIIKVTTTCSYILVSLSGLLTHLTILLKYT